MRSNLSANIGSWSRLAARRMATFVPWKPRATADAKNPYNVGLQLEDLEKLITEKTRLVAFTACSNILGGFVNVKEAISLVRKIGQAKGARKIEVCVDCVAYAPHRLIDVQDWDVDYVCFSYYKVIPISSPHPDDAEVYFHKVYGPHISVLYTRQAALESLTSLAHYFLKSPSYKLQPGGPGYEVTYGTSGVLPYLVQLASQAPATADFEALQVAFARIAAHEQLLMEPLITYLLSKWDSGVRIVGPESWKLEDRAPTISFVVVGDDGKTKRLLSKVAVAEFDETGNVSQFDGILSVATDGLLISDWHPIRTLLRRSTSVRSWTGSGRRRHSHFTGSLQHRRGGTEDHCGSEDSAVEDFRDADNHNRTVTSNICE